MKALITQFDDYRLSNAVATPTCSSCCCCCCCLATSISASSLLAQRVNKEAAIKQIPRRGLLTLIATLFVPIVGLLVYFGFWTINTLASTCEQRTYGYTDSEYTICTNPAGGLILPMLIIAPLLVLWFLYTAIKIEKPLARAVMVTILISISFVAEAFAGAVMILTGVGGLIYLALVPVIIGWISIWYRGHIGKDVVTATPSPVMPVQQVQVMGMPAPPVAPPEVVNQVSEPNEEPPQQDPPTPSAQ